MHAELHANLHAARRRAVPIDRGFYCTSNLHSNAADGLLNIQYAPRKRKINYMYTSGLFLLQLVYLSKLSFKTIP
jgi:hypothetical protein